MSSHDAAYIEKFQPTGPAEDTTFDPSPVGTYLRDYHCYKCGMVYPNVPASDVIDFTCARCGSNAAWYVPSCPAEFLMDFHRAKESILAPKE